MSLRSDLSAVVADYRLRGTDHVPIIALEKILARRQENPWIVPVLLVSALLLLALIAILTVLLVVPA